MIYLSTGAILDKELEVTDYSDGRRFGNKLGWLSTFHPCRVCKNTKCKRTQYGPCDDEYFQVWKRQFLKGTQLTLDNFGGRA